MIDSSYNRSALKDTGDDAGITMLEVLVSILIVGVTSMGIVRSVGMALNSTKHTEFNHIASSLATSKMEELAAIKVANLDTSFAGTESSVAWPGFNATFTRLTEITVNADQSRSVTVRVTSNSSYASTSVEFTNLFATWE